MIEKLFTKVLQVMWLASAFGMGPEPMNDAEFKLYADHSNNKVIFEIPETSGYRVGEYAGLRGVVLAGYEVSEILSILEEEYDICVSDELVTIPASRIREAEPYQIEGTLTGIEKTQYFGIEWNFLVPRNGYAPGGSGSHIIGLTGGNMTLSTVPCA